MAPHSHIFQPVAVRHPAERRPRPDGRAAVGLTGGVASGKSTALRFFADLGARVLSADAVVHALYERAYVRRAIHSRWGDAVIGADGRVDRRALAGVVTRDAEAMRALEGVVHPLVSREIERFIGEAPLGAVVVCEVPLLVDTHTQDMFDLVVTIEAPADLRRARAAERLAPEFFSDLDGRLVGEAARAAVADAAFVNDGSADDLRTFCAGVYESARLLAAREVSDVLEGE